MIIFGGQWHLKIENPWLVLLKNTFMGDNSFRHVFWMCLNMLCTTKLGPIVDVILFTAFIIWFLILKYYFFELFKYFTMLVCQTVLWSKIKNSSFFVLWNVGGRHTHIYYVHVLKGVCSCMITLAVHIQIWLWYQTLWVTLTCEQAEIISWENL